MVSSKFPKMPVDRYIRYDELTSVLREAAEARPDLVRLDSIGRSFEGREIWCCWPQLRRWRRRHCQSRRHSLLCRWRGPCV